MTIKLNSFTVLTGHLPCSVNLVLSDSSVEEEAKVWITARFEFQGRSDCKLGLIEQEALQIMQKLIDEGIEAVKVPPG